MKIISHIQRQKCQNVFVPVRPREETRLLQCLLKLPGSRQQRRTLLEVEALGEGAAGGARSGLSTRRQWKRK